MSSPLLSECEKLRQLVLSQKLYYMILCGEETNQCALEFVKVNIEEIKK